MVFQLSFILKCWQWITRIILVSVLWPTQIFLSFWVFLIILHPSWVLRSFSSAYHTPRPSHDPHDREAAEAGSGTSHHRWTWDSGKWLNKGSHGYQELKERLEQSLSKLFLPTRDGNGFYQSVCWEPQPLPPLATEFVNKVTGKEWLYFYCFDIKIS